MDRRQHSRLGNTDPVVPATYWDFGDVKEDLIHRIHAYPAKFPAFLTTKALQFALQNDVKVDLVADVFCGCGTTAVEAIRNGKRFWGCDINPVATLIANVKTRSYDDEGLKRKFGTIERNVKALQSGPKLAEPIPDRLRYWYDHNTIVDLAYLRQAIDLSVPPKSRYRKFFRCAFSNILKPTSRWLTKSIKPQVDPNKVPRAVGEAFADQVTLMRKANSQHDRTNVSVSTQSTRSTSTAQVSIRTRNFLASRPPSCRPDLIVTSPPYVTSYDYADIHQLSALWLRFADDYRDLRMNMLGNDFRVKPLSRGVIKKLGTLALDTYDTLIERDKRKARSVARYFRDLNRTVSKCWKILNANGMAVFVIGNTTYQGTTIDNCDYLCQRMACAGFTEITAFERRVSLKIMTPYRDARGRFTRDSTKRNVYGKEFVVAGRRR